MSRCPTCRAPVQKEGNPAFPFCSPRCRLVDLGKWLGEEYRIPAVEEDEGDAPPERRPPPPPRGKA